MLFSKKTGDVNVDFLNQILSYEQMGIELGKSELQFGPNKVIEEETNEMIKTSKAMVRRLKPPATYDSHLRGGGMAYFR